MSQGKQHNDYAEQQAQIGAQLRLVSPEQMLSAIVESSEDAIIGKTLEGTIVSWNRGAARLYGYAAEEVLGQLISILVPADRPDELPAIMERLRRGERIDHYETVRVCKDGRRIDVSVSISPIKNPTGMIIGASTIARDITQCKQAETERERLLSLVQQQNERLQTQSGQLQTQNQELQSQAEEIRSQQETLLRAQTAREQLVARLERSNAELEQFAYVASHDLQEPLRMVASYVQLLARRYRGKLDADADDFIAYAVDGATRMQALINDLLSYSRVHTQGRPFESTASTAVLNRVLSNLQVTIEESEAEVTYDTLPAVTADPLQLAQLLQNLIGNAIKFHAEERPRVHVGVARQGDLWVFSVRDNGIGIAPEYFEQIFQVFQRLHGRTQYPGTGIGLAICKRIVERHGGRIWVESIPGKGATFHFTMPAEGKERRP